MGAADGVTNQDRRSRVGASVAAVQGSVPGADGSGHAAFGAAAVRSRPTGPASSATAGGRTDRPCRSSTTSRRRTTTCSCATMADRAKAKAVARNGKVSLCILDETWPFAYLQVYCDAVIDDDGETLVDVMMAVAERMSGEPLGTRAAPDRQGHGRRGGPGAGALPALRHVRDAAATSAPQRPGGAADPLGLGVDALGRSRRPRTKGDVPIRQRGRPLGARRFRRSLVRRIEGKRRCRSAPIRWVHGCSSTIFTERRAPSPTRCPTDT